MKNKFRINGKILQHMQDWEKGPKARPADVPKPSTQPAEDGVMTGTHVTWRTDVGRVRANNQDAVICAGNLLGVADGMGGHNGGEIASAGARDGLIKSLEGKAPSVTVLSDAVKEVNLCLFDKQNENRDLEGMGTTLTVLWVDEKQIHLGHVGDSRAYLLREGILRRMTADHSMVAEMVRKGLLTEEQAAHHPMRNYITRAVGTELTVNVDTDTVERQKGDRWLVCSDGLHGLVSEPRLKELMEEADPERAADLLLQEALNNGGRDNISLVLFSDEGVGE